MNLFLDGIFDESCDSPNKVTISFTEWTGTGTSNRSLRGLLASEVSFRTANQWGPYLQNLAYLADVSSLVGTQSMLSWVGASAMCWKATKPISLAVDFYLINYKKNLGLEDNLAALTKLTALAQVTTNDTMSKISVAVHGGYAATDILKDNKSMFENKNFVSERLSDLNKKANEWIKDTTGIVFPRDKSDVTPGTVTIKVGNKIKLDNLLVSSNDITPSNAEVEDGKALFYRVNLSLTGVKPLLTTDVNKMFLGKDS